MEVYGRIEDGSVGMIAGDYPWAHFQGDVVTIKLHDENGNEITKEGVLEELI